MNSPSPRPLVPSDLSSTPSLARAAFAMALAAAQGADPSRIAASRWPHDVEVVQGLLRASVAGADTSTSGWAAELVASAVSRFLTGLTPQSAMAAVISRGIRVRLADVASIDVPFVSPAAWAGAWIGEDAPIAISSGV